MEEEKRLIRVIIIDDHPTIRDGLRVTLDEDRFLVGGEAECVGDARALIGSGQFDLALLDLSLGEESGLELVGALHEAGIQTLIFSMYEDAGTIRRAFLAGVKGYVTKREEVDVLLDGIAEVLAGRTYVSPRAARSLALGQNSAARNDSAPALLTSRQQEVLSLLAGGLSYRDIGRELDISETTVKYHLSEILNRLQLDNRVQAIAYYFKHLTA